MIKDIDKICIENGFFDSSILDIYGEKGENGIPKYNISIIYGANGAGKTTIGRAFSYIKNPTDYGEFINSSYLLDCQGNTISLSDDEKQNIYVYSEDFIEKEVAFKSLEKMKSIVIFGKNIENEVKIKELSKQIDDNKKIIADLHLEKYEDNEDSLSPLMYYEQIKKLATKDWAVEEQKILERTTKPQATDDVMTKILSQNTVKKFDLDKYENKKESYKKLEGKNPQPINNENLKNISFNINIKNIEELLGEHFSKPIGSELITRITETLSEKTFNRLDEIADSFKEGYCPFCFRDIDADYVKHIIDEINNIQSDDIKNHVANLKKNLLDEIDIDLSDFKLLDSELVEDMKNSLVELNKFIKELNNLIESKINNPYDSIDVNTIIVFDDANLKQKILKIEAKRIAYNQDIINKSKLKIELQGLNLLRFATNEKVLVSNYLKQKEEKENKLASKIKLDNSIEIAQKEIQKLNYESENISIALNKINENLGLIFLSKNRLYLEENDGAYIVKRGNKSIQLKKLSNGERNAISLCYFFTIMNANKREESMFTSPSLVVLDDPLSSFDCNNKIGIYAFLKRMFSRILEVTDSKLVLLTHQIETYFDLQKVVDDIPKKHRANILVEKKLELDKNKTINFYRNSLKEIYKAVTKTEPLSNDEAETLGNKFRKVLEAFSTFVYGCGIAKLSTDSSIIESLEQGKVRDYFIDSMYRISLNSTSHLEERTCSLIDLLNISYFDKEGLLRSAKDALVLMYLLNPQHINKMLDINNDEFFVHYIDEIKSSELNKY